MCFGLAYIFTVVTCYTKIYDDQIIIKLDTPPKCPLCSLLHASIVWKSKSFNGNPNYSKY